MAIAITMRMAARFFFRHRGHTRDIVKSPLYAHAHKTHTKVTLRSLNGFGMHGACDGTWDHTTHSSLNCGLWIVNCVRVCVCMSVALCCCVVCCVIVFVIVFILWSYHLHLHLALSLCNVKCLVFMFFVVS